MFAQNMFKRIAMVASTTLLMSASAWAANPTLKIELKKGAFWAPFLRQMNVLAFL